MHKKILSIVLIAAMFMPAIGCADKTVVNENIYAATSTDNSDAQGIPPAENEIPIENGAPIEEPEDVYYILNLSSRYKTYDTIEELEEAASDIIIGVCASSGAIFQNDMMYSLAEVRITEVIKGSQEIEKVILVLEPGGRTTMDEYSKNTNIPTKSFEDGGQPLSDDTKIVQGVDGYFPLKEGEIVLLFLGDINGFIEAIEEPLYTVVGGYDGTLHVQTDAFKRPIPAETDNRMFEGSILSINMTEITEMINENNEGLLKK